MKQVIALVILVVGFGYGQIINEKIDGVVQHQTFNPYTKSSYTQATANETTAFVPYKGSSRLSVFATVTDTVKASLRFQFKNSFTGYTTDWRVVSDSISLIGSSSTLASDRVHAFVASDTSTAGYDLVRFYIDYVTYLGVSYTGGTLKLYVDLYKP